MLRRAARIFAEDEIATEEGLRWGWVAAIGHDRAVGRGELAVDCSSGSSSPPVRRACSSTF